MHLGGTTMITAPRRSGFGSAEWLLRDSTPYVYRHTSMTDVDHRSFYIEKVRNVTMVCFRLWWGHRPRILIAFS